MNGGQIRRQRQVTRVRHARGTMSRVDQSILSEHALSFNIKAPSSIRNLSQCVSRVVAQRRHDLDGWIHAVRRRFDCFWVIREISRRHGGVLADPHMVANVGSDGGRRLIACDFVRDLAFVVMPALSARVRHHSQTERERQVAHDLDVRLQVGPQPLRPVCVLAAVPVRDGVLGNHWLVQVPIACGVGIAHWDIHQNGTFALVAFRRDVLVYAQVLCQIHVWLVFVPDALFVFAHFILSKHDMFDGGDLRALAELQGT
mmetsp:Transcript_17483/g.27915  ORF Transcript_17483/g.27915 Transcript_17483/m.27915 type:complete len:258 (-) Transcript_17483:118-891(-)